MGGRRVTLTWQHEPALHAPARYRRACRYEAWIADPLGTGVRDITAKLAGVISEAEAAIRELNASARPILAPLSRLLLRTESIASSKVEGLQMGVRQLARAEARMDTGGRVGPEALEIMANVDAMDLAIDEAASVSRFSTEEILAIHARLMERVAHRHIAGRVRTVQNWIGGNDYNPCGADFVPPPPEYVGPLLEDLCAAINDDLLPAVMQAALVHAQFETIHPFDDGNGRTGRALIHVVLRRRGVAPAYVPPISVVLAAARDRYVRGLNDYREDGVDAWIGHFAGAALRAATLASEYVAAVQALTAEWRARLSADSAPRADSAAWAIVDVLPAHPVISAPVAAASTGRSRPQVYQAIRLLERAGVLLPLTEQRRHQSWEADGLLDLIAGLEAGVPVSAIPTR
jgi:Fic family protein